MGLSNFVAADEWKGLLAETRADLKKGKWQVSEGAHWM
jgi:hypothetical protein